MEIKGISVPIKLIRSKRKTLCAQVTPDGGLTVRAPLKASESEIERFILSNKVKLEGYIKKAADNNKKLEKLKPFTSEEMQEMFQKAAELIPERVKYYAPLIGVTYGRITIRNQKTRWGSCSSKGNLNFNCLLVMTPPEVMDSVVVHELCHRKHMNHSKEFYNEIYRVYPEYDKWDKWLKANGSLLIKRMTG